MNDKELLKLQSKHESVSMSLRDWFRVINLIGRSDEEDASVYIDKIQSELSLSIMEHLRRLTEKEDDKEEDDERILREEVSKEFIGNESP